MLFLKSFGSTEADQRQDSHDHDNEAYEVDNSAHFSHSLLLPHAGCCSFHHNNVNGAATFRRSDKIFFNDLDSGE
jgi:hypothetical protein